MMEVSNPYDSPQQAARAEFPLETRRVCIKRIDLLSTATMMGVLYAIIGLIVGGFFTLMVILGVAAGGGDAALGGLIGGVGSLIILPILYGAMGFIGGLLGAALYNFVATFAGGVKLDLAG